MKRTTSLTSILGVVVALAVGLTGSAPAQDFVATYWDHDPSEPGSWFNQYNWTGGVPNAWTTAYINNGGTAVINERSDGTSIDGSWWGAGAQWLILGGVRSGTVIQNSGALRVTSDIWLGWYGYGPGNYNLIDGRFSATNALIASGPAWYAWSNILPGYGSAFRQAGGASAISGTLQVGYQPYSILLSSEPVTTTEDLTQTIAGTDVDYLYRPGALYKLSAGELATGTTYVGYGGKGRFVQSGGAHSVRGGVYVGGGTNWIYTADQTRPDPDSFYIYPSYYTDGTYLLTDGKVSAGSVHVGQRGRGRFAQSGGSVRVERTLQVGGDWWWWRPMDSTGTEPAPSEMESIVPPRYDIPANGTYTLTRGELITGATEIGIGGVGRFVQSGGVHQVGGVLRVGGRPYLPIMTTDDPTQTIGYTGDGTQMPEIWPYPGPSDGRYTITAGRVRAARLEIAAGYRPWYLEYTPLAGGTLGVVDGIVAPWEVGVFRQSGGGVEIEGAVQLLGGSYELSGGELSAGSVRMNGRYIYDNSRFTQSGGLSRIAGGIYLGTDIYLDRSVADAELSTDFAPYYGTETLLLSGGRLYAGHVRIGGSGRALFLQTGGAATIYGSVRIVGAGAAYSIHRGYLNAAVVQVGGAVSSGDNSAPGGRFSIAGRDAKIIVRNKLVFGTGGRFTAVRGARIHMNGASLENYSTDPIALGGLDNTRMVFSIGPEDDLEWETFEVAGKDLGFVRRGFYNNFVLRTLQLGGEDVGEVRLVDEFDNQPEFEGAEALYVRYLIVGPGSSLDLNGLNLYYLSGRIHDDARIIGDGLKWISPTALTVQSDADLSGYVDDDDLSVLLANWGQESDWTGGDFSGDRVVGDDDLSLLLANWHASAPPLTDGDPVPEPMTLSLLVLGALGTVARRRRTVSSE